MDGLKFHFDHVTFVNLNYPFFGRDGEVTQITTSTPVHRSSCPEDLPIGTGPRYSSSF